MNRLNHMVDMAKTAEEIKEGMPSPVSDNQPIYPYGLSICLTQDELEKLEVDYADWQVGDLFHLHAMAKITSISENETANGKNCRVEMQIVALSGEDEDLENEEDEENESVGPVGNYGPL